MTEVTVGLRCSSTVLNGDVFAALAHERDPAQDKCTMLNPNAARHLRGGSTGVQPGALLSATSEGSLPAYPQGPVGPLGLEEGPQQPDWGWRHHRRQRQRPTGQSLMTD